MDKSSMIPSTSSGSSSNNAQDNARTKVSIWLSGLVEEVRKKSQGPMQKWVDNNLSQKDLLTSKLESNLTKTEISTNTNITKTSQQPVIAYNNNDHDENGDNDQINKIKESELTSMIKSLNTQHSDNKNSNDINSQQKQEEEKQQHQLQPENLHTTKSSSRKIWSKEALLTRFNQSFDKTRAHALDSTTFSKLKINEIYDRVRINKIKQNFMKIQLQQSQKMDEKQFSISNKNNLHSDIKRHSDNTIQQQDSTNQLNVIIKKEDDDEDRNINEKYIKKSDDKRRCDSSIENDILYSHKLNIHEEEEDEEENETKNVNTTYKNLRRCSDNSHDLIHIPKKKNLENIGRSFSEAADDGDIGDDDLYLLNERSQSYSHVINTKSNQIMANNSNKNLYSNNSNCSNNNNNNNNNNNISSHSLPSCFDNNHQLPSTSVASISSQSISPLLRLKSAAAGTTTTLSSSSLPLNSTINRDKFDFPNRRRSILLRDSSIQSDSSHCSSVESLLESRKPDPEAILVNLGFGPIESEDILSRIPKRFLKPSQVRGIDTEAFLRRQQLANHLHDHSVLGYRGLVGNPDIPPSTIVAKIMERFEQNERKRCIMDINMNRPQSAPPTPGPNSLN